MINGPENLIQTGYFFLQLHKSEPVTAGGRHRMLLYPGARAHHLHRALQTRDFHKNSLTEKEQKAWRHSKDSGKGNEMKWKGNEGLKEGKGLGGAGKFDGSE